MRGVRDLPFPTVEEARAYRYDPQEEALRRLHRDRHIIGSPARVRDEVRALVDASSADEVMIVTQIHSHEARRRSYTLVAEALGVVPR